MGIIENIHGVLLDARSMFCGCVCILFVFFELFHPACEEVYHLHFSIEEIGPDNFHSGHVSSSLHFGCLPVFVSVD